jgi:hypothetical protein
MSIKREAKELVTRAYNELHPSLQKRADQGVRASIKAKNVVKVRSDSFRSESQKKGKEFNEKVKKRVDNVKSALTLGLLAKGKKKKPQSKTHYIKGMFDDVMGKPKKKK